MSGDDLAKNLRVQLAEAMCAVQSLPVPRSTVSKMLKNLLHHAFELLDDDRAADWEMAQRVAIFALSAWNASNSDGSRLLSATA